MRESQVEKYLVKRARALGGEVRKVAWIGRRGAPDRILMLPWDHAVWIRGAVVATVWVEAKATGVPAEDYQLREHERMRKHGQAVVVIDSIEGVDALLDGHA